MIEPKTALTPQEKLKAAYLHLLRGVTQQDLGVAFEVNQGRVNEAIDKAKVAFDWKDTP